MSTSLLGHCELTTIKIKLKTKKTKTNKINTKHNMGKGSSQYYGISYPRKSRLLKLCVWDMVLRYLNTKHSFPIQSTLEPKYPNNGILTSLRLHMICISQKHHFIFYNGLWFMITCASKASVCTQHQYPSPIIRTMKTPSCNLCVVVIVRVNSCFTMTRYFWLFQQSQHSIGFIIPKLVFCLHTLHVFYF